MISDNKGAAPLSDNDFDEMQGWMDASFREYMHARQVLSTLSESTVRRYSRGLPRQPRMTKEEKDLSHALVAAVHTYQQDAVACAQSGADFASGLMASAACEALTIFWLLQKKREVKKTKKFKKLWYSRNRVKRVASSITFSRLLVELRVDDLYGLAREAGLYDEQNLSAPVADVLASRGYTGRLTEFVKRARNCIHPKHNLEANDRYAKMLDVFFSPEGMKSFHADFALCAWELHGRLSQAHGDETPSKMP
jgi:hypothetical protein